MIRGLVGKLHVRSFASAFALGSEVTHVRLRGLQREAFLPRACPARPRARSRTMRHVEIHYRRMHTRYGLTGLRIMETGLANHPSSRSGRA